VGGLDINVGDALPYLVNQFLELIGEDGNTRLTARELRLQQQIAIKDSSTIQMVGMPDPVPFPDIYEPVKLEKSGFEYDAIEVVRALSNAVVFGLPGTGKTTVIHSMFQEALKSSVTIPLLFTLRRAHAVENLQFVISALEENGKAIKKLKPHRFTLFLDGYDELSERGRKRVSEYLTRFNALDCGNYIVSCRSHYDVYDLKLSRYTIGSLNRDISAKRFVENFGRIFNTRLDADKLLAELDKRGFASFYAHPLLLTLVCLLKVHLPNVDLPANTVSLLTDAVNMLAFRWDLSMGTTRESLAKIGGHERLNCLMRIASSQREPTYREDRAIDIASEHLRLMHRKDVDPRQLLIEIARFYGLFVPVHAGWWDFVHRTIQDYLAARFNVETGQFGRSTHTHHFEFREAYAACLNPDSATDFMVRALGSAPNMMAFHECIHNHAAYDSEAISGPLVNRYLKNKSQIEGTKNADWLRIDIQDDWLLNAPTELLAHCLEKLSEAKEDRAAQLTAACLIEIHSRELERLPSSLLKKSVERLKEWCSIIQVNINGTVRTALVKDLYDLNGDAADL